MYNLMAFKIKILTEQLAGALALLVYEYFLTLDDEVELIWPYVNYSTIHGRADGESIQETKSFVSQVVVFIYEIFRGGIANVSVRFVPYIPMFMVLRYRQSATIETCSLNSARHASLLSTLVYVAFSRMSNHAYCCRSNIDYARSVFLTPYLVND